MQQPIIGCSLSSEEHPGSSLVRFGAMARDHGFRDLVVSDHFHPWVGAQGNSPFVWSVLGGLAAMAPDARLGTAVTCPTFRLHPVITAQAAATTAEMAPGFFLGVGSGENLNEHVLGDRWPPADERLARMEEAVELMRRLWRGDEVTFEGRWYQAESARLWTRPSSPVPVYVSAFGEKAAKVAARIGDGLITTGPASDIVATYRDAGGTGPAIAATKVCFAEDEGQARRFVHRLWPSSGLPGQLAQELRTPAVFEQACELVDEETAVGATPVGPDPEVHVAGIRTYLDAGFDQVYVHQIGPDQARFLRFFRDEVLPRLGLS
ncbi:MAG: TIGR03557 family F420-dependent LLM class oxidoreductase [Acidimicrobiales bacterium]